MHEKIEIAEELFEKAKHLGRTKLELYKLKAIDKASDIFATIATGALMIVVLIFLLAMLSTGVALYLGEVLGKIHYGFFAVAGIYAVIAILVIAFKKTLLTDFFTNFIINTIFKDKRDASNNK